MNVVQLLDSLAFGKDVEVVEAQLPETRAGVRDGARCSLLEDLHGERGISDVGFADQQVDVFGHDDVSEDDELVFLADFFENAQDESASGRFGKKWNASITTEGKEVEMTFSVVTFQVNAHVKRLGEEKVKSL